MADEKTGADALRLYLTGVFSDDGVEYDPDVSLGNYRSCTLARCLGFRVVNPFTNVRIDYVAGENGAGNGFLEAATTGSLRWTPPGGTTGSAVTIANGETKVIPGATASKWVRVTRTSTADLVGSMTMVLTEEFNNAVGMDNVSSAEAAAGDTEYRCLAFKAWAAVTGLKAWLPLLGTAAAVDATGYSTGAVTVGGGGTSPFADWPHTGFVENEDTGEVMYYTSRTADELTVPAAGRDIWNETGGGAGTGMAGDEADVLNPIPGMRIAKEAPASGHFTDKTGAGEGSQPAGLTWEHPTSASDGDVILIGDMAADAIYGLWLERKAPVGMKASADLKNGVLWGFTAGGTAYTAQTKGRYRVANDALALYEIYRGVDEEADLAGDPWETAASLPHETAALDADHTYHFVTRYRNEYDLVSKNIDETLIALDSEGNEIEPLPSAPRDIAVSAYAGRTVRVQANYYYFEDEEDARATVFALWYTSDGTEPDPEAAADATVAVAEGDGIAKLDTSIGPFTEQAEVKVLVRMRRVDGETNYDSINTTSSSATATAGGPEIVDPAEAFFAAIANQHSFVPWNKWLDEGSGNFINVNPNGEVEFYIASKLLLRFTLSGNCESWVPYDNISTDLTGSEPGTDVDFSGGVWRIFEPVSGNQVLELSASKLTIDNTLAYQWAQTDVYADAGSDEAVDSDADEVFISVKGVRVAEVTASAFRLAGAWRFQFE